MPRASEPGLSADADSPAEGEAAAVQVTARELASPAGITRLRCYTPRRRVAAHSGTARSNGQAGRAPSPGIVFFHAGGYVAGDEARHAPFCTALAQASEAVVVSCSYRLAPEHKFPAAVEDAYFAASFVHEHADELGIDHRLLAIAGIEAGAALASSVARLAKERRNPSLILQLLIGPLLDLREGGLPREQANGEASAREHLRWAAEQYVRADADRADPRVSPLIAKNLIGLPPALILSAERDVLRDQAEQFAHALGEAGVRVALRCQRGAEHGFWDDPESEAGRAAVRACAGALADALSPARASE